MAVEANDQGDYFPLWGTCLGFEFLTIAVSGSIDTLTHFDAENISLPLKFTSYSKRSRLFSNLNHKDQQHLLRYLSRHNASENYHHYGLSMDDYYNTEALSDFYEVISTSLDRQDRVFVESFEAKDYPFYGVQYHPEKSLFEWSTNEDTDHTESTISAMQYHGRFFVKEATKSNHSYASVEEEIDSLVFNYQALFDYKKYGYATFYLFDTQSHNAPLSTLLVK